MPNKKEVEAITNTLIPLLQDSLRMNDVTINWVVGHSKSKLFRDLDDKQDFAAICYPEGNNIYNIFVCYNKQRGIEDTIGSVLHEMLHVRFRSIRELIKNNKVSTYDELEEDIVQGLEKFFLLFLKQ